MPESDIFRRKLREYLKVLANAKLCQRTIDQYRWFLLQVEKFLLQQDITANPHKLAEKEIALILDANKYNPVRVSILRKFLKFCENKAIEKMRIPTTSCQRIHVDWLELYQADLVREATNNPLEKLLVHLELDLGLRRIECLRLRLQDVHPGYLNVLGKGRMGGKWRTIPIHPKTPEVLAEYLSYRTSLIEVAKKKLRSNDILVVPEQLFIHRGGKKILIYRQEHAISQILKKIESRLHNAGIQIKFSNHTLRRTFGRTLWKAGVPIETIATLMGHESIDMTIKYLGIKMDDMQDAMQKLAQYTQNASRGNEGQKIAFYSSSQR